MFDNVAKNTLGPLILRLTLAAIFIYHGQLLVSKDKEWGAKWMDPKMNQPPAVQMAVAWGELVGGVAMALGLLTRLAALGLIVIMAGAIYQVHLKNGFDIRNGGYEYNVAIIAMCLALVLTGPGRLALDHVFFRRRKPVG
jgi:putative oxidoreductase